jgi:hypothetical protein
MKACSLSQFLRYVRFDFRCNMVHYKSLFTISDLFCPLLIAIASHPIYVYFLILIAFMSAFFHSSVSFVTFIISEMFSMLNISLQDDKGFEYKKKSRNIIVCIIIPILAVVCYSCYHIYQVDNNIISGFNSHTNIVLFHLAPGINNSFPRLWYRGGAMHDFIIVPERKLIRTQKIILLPFPG